MFMRRNETYVFLAALVAVVVTNVGCAARVKFIGGTRIADSAFNREILDTVEKYRRAVERGDRVELLRMASKNYWEDSGTPSGSDDYGYDGLKKAIAERVTKASDIRYSIRYVKMRSQCAPDNIRDGCRANLEALIDASFSIIDASGKARRPDKRDQGEFVLERQGDQWLFVAGM
jgi:hypothetical protein